MQNDPTPNYPPQNYAPGQPTGQPPKKSKTPLIIAGVLGCLALIVVVIALFGGLAYLGLKKASDVADSLNANADRNANRSANRGTTPAPRPSGTRHYANARQGRTGNLDKYYVDFSFDYPS
ncbi:MAG: hypothetical protein ABR554_07655, partial [Pyrinomonadaceae bacterium]